MGRPPWPCGRPEGPVCTLARRRLRVRSTPTRVPYRRGAAYDANGGKSSPLTCASPGAVTAADGPELSPGWARTKLTACTIGVLTWHLGTLHSHRTLRESESRRSGRGRGPPARRGSGPGRRPRADQEGVTRPNVTSSRDSGRRNLNQRATRIGWGSHDTTGSGPVGSPETSERGQRGQSV